MRRLARLVPAVLFFCSCTSPSPPREREPAGPVVPAAAPWVTVARGALAEIAVERALYEEPGHPHFYAHVRVHNPTAAPVSVDLRSYDTAYRINQWGASSTPNRGAIDERRLIPDGPLGAAEQAALLADHRAGALTAVPANGFGDYHVEFNAHDRAAVESQSKGLPYVILAMDGHLRVTDGKVVERVDPASDDRAREVTLDTPVRWAVVPAGAMVLRSR